ncbi:unnamed protein product [Dovyalis caffra]|uniref:Alpha/beta hydrolase fold-3 domain-containing protein n=1 Tax=Dovyalis caffra TaxID=77055 RepID=A0AAV1RVQ3_9ROSI|nr:unnamed protein product [Dovyalis caffra]
MLAMASSNKIAVEVPGWIQVFEDGTVDRTWTGPPEVGFLLKPVPRHEKFVAVRDQIIDPNNGRAVRVYISETNCNVQIKAKLPLILHLHGGCYCVTQPDWALYLALAVIVSVYLRLAPEHMLPVAFEDANAALPWLRANACSELSDQWLTNYADFTQSVFGR